LPSSVRYVAVLMRASVLRLDDAHEVYGPGLVNAYTLESTVADYPRIVTGSGLIAVLEYFLQLPLEPVLSQTLADVFEASR
jgi:hypothetical protein